MSNVRVLIDDSPWAVRTARNIFLVILGFAAWVIIGISGASFRERGGDLTFGDVAYVFLLVLAFLYFHWAFRIFLMPLSKLPPAKREALIDWSEAKYCKGFFRGTIGFGYLMLALYVAGFLVDMPDRHRAPNLTLAAIFCVGLGTLAQARGVILALTKDDGPVRESTSVAPNGGPSTPVGSSAVTEQPPR